MSTYKKLEEIRQRTKAKIDLRHFVQKEINLDEGLNKDGKTHVLVCAGTGCHASDGDEIRARLFEKAEELGLSESIDIHKTGCFGLCEAGPNIVVFPQGIFYSHVTLNDVDEIVESHFQNGNIVERLVFKESRTGEDHIHPVNEVNFYKHQKRVTLANCGVINPELIEEYIAFDGYQALYKAVTEQTPEEVITVIEDSGLRGRGGAGFPTGKKWHLTAIEKSKKKYVACNADEGDPGAFMDRSILEGDPHAVIEAMAIAAYCIGADEGVIYVRAEYPIAVRRLEIAIEQAKELGLLGDNIFETDFSFHLRIRLGAGAFVCGEETALIESIEGKRGIPRNKPPFPAQRGIFNKPTLINNVETYANIPAILRNGVEWFRSIGTEASPGTKVFSLGGNVVNTGLIEVPTGTTFREVIYDIGGGIPKGRKFKAVQTGGPSGGCIPEEYLDTPIDFDTLRELGSMMGSGGLIVMDDSNCMVDIARFYLDFTVDESCGKCTPCRIGNKRLLEMLIDLTRGKSQVSDIQKMGNLGETIIATSACGLGQSSPNPVLSTIRYFADEYIAHARDHRCPAGVCKDLVSYTITDKCIGCTKCKRQCPVDCIEGTLKELHVIEQEACIKCGACFDACPVHAIEKR